MFVKRTIKHVEHFEAPLRTQSAVKISNELNIVQPFSRVENSSMTVEITKKREKRNRVEMMALANV